VVTPTGAGRSKLVASAAVRGGHATPRRGGGGAAIHRRKSAAAARIRTWLPGPASCQGVAAQVEIVSKG